MFAQPGPGAALADRPVRVSALVSFRGERQTLGPKELHRLVRKLVQETESRAPGTEREAVADVLTTTLSALGDLDMDDVQAVGLGHGALAARLRAEVGGPLALRDLSADSTALYEQLLDAACVNVLHFFTQRSPFVARTLVEQSRRLHRLTETTGLLVERIPAQAAEDAGFEERYARYVAGKHSRLTIYGVDLSADHEWPLDTAYLSLQATGGPEHPDEFGLAAPLPRAQPVEQALAGHARVLLRGNAGSGKTTLVQWLAVTTARQRELTGTLAHLVGRVPFVLPLRTLTRRGAELPAPADFLGAVGSPLAGAQPPRWADRVLAAGRALLLVDGLDEVPERERARARTWLTDLLAAYPDNLCLVTSRPSAVRQDWLGAEDFTELTLARMSRDDIAVFVERWHEAAGAEPGGAAALLDALRTQQDLGALATNPLMCALVCALHRERRGSLPRGRKALYDAALSMLLERRDRERDMPGAGLDLDEESQTELLQRLAYWLIRNGRSELDRADALAVLDRLLPAMPYVAGQGDAEAVLRHLLTRSGLLREPAAGALDFVHRTFQDYLGARAAVEERDFDLLLRHAHLDQWEDVLRMAVAHARPDERARLLRGLVTRGDQEPDHRTRLHLLATACLEHAAKLDPAVRAEVEERAGRLIPPRDFYEARALAEVGPIVLGLLPGPDDLSDPAFGQYVLQTAGIIGGDAALARVREYREFDGEGISVQLGQFWDKFDTDTYGREIIDGLRSRPRTSISVHSAQELTLLQSLGGHDNLDVVGNFTATELAGGLGRWPLTRLRIAGNSALDDIGFVRDFADLRDLTFHDCPNISSLAPLTNLPLTALMIPDVPPEELHALRSLTALQWLSMWPVTAESALDDVPREAPLTYLSVPTNLQSLSALPDFPTVEILALHTDNSFTPQDWAGLSRLPRLRHLVLSVYELGSLAASGTVLENVTHVNLRGPSPDTCIDARMLLPAFPALEDLFVFDAGWIDLAGLGDLAGLRQITLDRARKIVHADTLPARINVKVAPRYVETLDTTNR
ncbi:NACHT domain-containing protein [Streptomyces sp. SID5785]|uniref:NACHT domain-containing protein n=1 Tax=Streptomyces sp. SID5785 TaxID=2690309 RepID=UPI001361118F|nr:NACHT domain-containing protein [Streptomyces sp. SID5785]MZD04493.1 NACHT domain-containing protein [Streptomyces sp. SID5785]